ncbi:hypothetical protein C8Q77DRAFT_1073310 [Trametes polyzona]|nr:hypothetical protein C8Q77DRAFT_1073310 [Trametes polyzona]
MAAPFLQAYRASLDLRLTLASQLTMIRSHDLDGEHAEIRRFAQMSADEKLVMLLIRVLSLQGDLKQLSLCTTRLEPRLLRVEELTQQAWRPSKAQVSVICSLIRHFLVKPISNYNSLPTYVKSYVKDNTAKLRLGIYLKDQTVKVTLNMVISELSSQMKSAFRKAVFASCRKKIPLSSFARNILDNYHLPAIPAEIPLHTLGTLAFLCRIAEPLAKKANTSGGDTGFWRQVEVELNDLYDTFGSRDHVHGAEWIQWATEMAAGDRERFPTIGGRFSAATREELDHVLGTGHSRRENQDVDILNDGEDMASNQGEQEITDEDMDGDIEVGAMGDLSATVQNIQ